MNPLQIKICGVTRNQDARLAERLGATAIGLIFAESERRVSLEEARGILHGLSRRIGRVGVFANSALQSILDTVEQLELTGVQLHGQETSDFSLQLKRQRPSLTVIKAFALTGEDSIPEAEKFACDVLLFDSPRTDATRPLLDLRRLEERQPKRPFFIAGGLHAGNVRCFIETVHPAGVDVSSGIEFRPGIKCADAMTAFFHALSGRLR